MNTNIIVRKEHLIKVKAKDLKTNLSVAFRDILNDALDDDLNIFETETHRLSDAFSTINKCGFTPLFRDSYTMLLLPGNIFDYVEEIQGNQGEDKITIQITNFHEIELDRSDEFVDGQSLAY